MKAELPHLSDRGKMVMEVWFCPVTATTMQYSRAAIYVAGDVEYQSEPSLLPGQAGVIEWDRNADQNRVVTLAPVEVQVAGSQVYLRVPAELLSNYCPVIAVVRYLPSQVNPEQVGTGLGGCFSSYQVLNHELIGRSMPLPPFPERRSGGEEYTSPIEDPHRFGIPPSRRKREIMPPDVVPPRERWPKPGDIDNDGDSNYDLPVDMPVVGLIIIDVWITDDGNGSAYVIVIGKDIDGDGQLDEEEIWFPIGECPHNPGINYGYIGGDGKIYWISYRDSNRNGQLDVGERQVTYIFIPERGELVVIVDPDGPGPLPPREVYRGNPNGYQWQF